METGVVLCVDTVRRSVDDRWTTRSLMCPDRRAAPSVGVAMLDRRDGEAPRVEYVVNRSPLLPVPCQTRHMWEDPEAETTTCRVCGALRAIVLWDPWSADEQS